MYEQGSNPARFAVLGRFLRTDEEWDILHRNAFSKIGFEVGGSFSLGKLYIPYKAIVNRDALGAAFANALGFMHLNFVNQLPKQRCGQVKRLEIFTIFSKYGSIILKVKKGGLNL